MSSSLEDQLKAGEEKVKVVANFFKPYLIKLIDFFAACFFFINVLFTCFVTLSPLTGAKMPIWVGLVIACMAITLGVIGWLIWNRYKKDEIFLLNKQLDRYYYFLFQFVVTIGLFVCLCIVASKMPSSVGSASLISSSSTTLKKEPKTLKGGDKVTGDVAESIRAYIQQNGYSCDKIREALVMNLKYGYMVLCQSGGRVYRYEVYARGGNWIVKVK